MTSSKKLSIYGFIGAGARVVGRNIFLEGNTFYPRHDVDISRIVGDFVWGVALDYRAFHMSYMVFDRSQEFKTQQDGFMNYGSITIGVSF